MITKEDRSQTNLNILDFQQKIVTILKNLDARVDALQKSQATLRPDIIEQIMVILKQHWKDDAARRREKTW